MDWIKKLKWKAVQTMEPQQLATEDDDGLETAEDKRRRMISLRIIYYTMFLMSLGFSVVLTAVWPFLDKLDPNAGKEFMGFVVAANPFGQMLFSPVIGLWANKSGSIRIPLIVTLLLFVFASGMHAFLEVFVTHKKYWMLFSRLLIGISSANTVAARSYLSAATRLNERTGAIAMISLAQVLGFVVGPILQGVVTLLGEEGFAIYGGLRMNMFTATGWMNVMLGLINLSLFLPFYFQEHKIAAKELMLHKGLETEKEAWKSIKPDYLACWTLIVAFFVLVFNFVLLETLGTSLTMDQFAWDKTKSLYYMSIIMSVGGVIACVVFAITNPMTKIFAERKLMLWGGFFVTMMATATLLPYGTDPPQMAIPQNLTLSALTELGHSLNFTNYTMEQIVSNLTRPGEELLGCPVTQTWCEYTPALTVTQLCVAYVLASIGYPLGILLIATIFSKILGPRPQGVWMGFLTGAGCLSRVMGPVFVGYVYSRLGPIWTFSITTGVMIVFMIWLQIVNKRLIPPELDDKPATEMQELNGNKQNGFHKK